MGIFKAKITVSGSSGAVKSANFPTMCGRIVCVALEKGTPITGGGISSSNPIRVGRNSSDDLIFESSGIASTSIRAFYPARMGCSTAGIQYASSDGAMAFQIPLDDERINVSINAGSSAGSLNLTAYAWIEGALYSSTS